MLLYKNSATNFKCRLLYDTHDLPCSIYKVSNHHAYIPSDMWWGKINLKHGTLGHAIEHGQVKGSHLTLNVQH